MGTFTTDENVVKLCSDERQSFLNANKTKSFRLIFEQNKKKFSQASNSSFYTDFCFFTVYVFFLFLLLFIVLPVN